MDWKFGFLILLSILGGLFAIGFWIPFALLLTGFAGLMIVGVKWELIISGVSNVFWDTGTDFILSQVPLFLLMGQVIVDSGISSRFYRSIAQWLRSVPGGLLQTNIVATGIFAAISGSSAATAAAVAPVAIPELTARRYDRSLTLGSLAAGGTLGILIPPSVPLIIYGVAVQQSIGELFTAGIIPGLIMLASFMVYIAVRVAANPQLVPQADAPMPIAERLRSLPHVIPLFILIAAVFGGLYGGFVTPTEAAALGAVVAVAIAFIAGEFSWSGFWQSVTQTVRTTAMIFLLIVGAKVFGFALTQMGITRGVVELVTVLNLPIWGLMLGLVALYLVLGALMDGIAMMLVTLPIVYPLIDAPGSTRSGSQIFRGGAGAGFQLAACPAGGRRGIHPEPEARGLDRPSGALR